MNSKSIHQFKMRTLKEVRGFYSYMARVLVFLLSLVLSLNLSFSSSFGFSDHQSLQENEGIDKPSQQDSQSLEQLTEEQRQILNSVYLWVKKNKRVPGQHDFNKDAIDGVGISYSKAFIVMKTSKLSGFNNLLYQYVFFYKNDPRVIKIFEDYFSKSYKYKKSLFDVETIKDRLLNWIIAHKAIPHFSNSDFNTDEFGVSVATIRLLLGESSSAGILRIIKAHAEQKGTNPKIIAIIDDALMRKIDKKDPDAILDLIYRWMMKNKRIPPISKFFKTEDQVGVSIVQIKKVFNIKRENQIYVILYEYLKKKGLAQEYWPELEEYISPRYWFSNHNYTPDELLQYIMDWVIKNKRVPNLRDFVRTQKQVDIPISWYALRNALDVKNQLEFLNKLLVYVKDKDPNSQAILIINDAIRSKIDKNDQDAVLNMIANWIIDHKRIPTLHTFQKSRYTIGIGISQLKMVFNIQHAYQIYEYIYDYLTKNNLAVEYLPALESCIARQKLNFLYSSNANTVLQIIYDWMLLNNKVPRTADFNKGQKQDGVDISWYTVRKSLNVEGIIEFYEKLLKFIIQKDKNSEFIPLLQYEINRVRLRGSSSSLDGQQLVIDLITKWMLKNKRLPQVQDFGYDTTRRFIGVTYRKALQELDVNGMSEFLEKLLPVFDAKPGLKKFAKVIRKQLDLTNQSVPVSKNKAETHSDSLNNIGSEDEDKQSLLSECVSMMQEQ